MQPLCRKTQLCRYHIVGQCKKGTACNFAHSAIEVTAKPDLTCTKICPTLLRVGKCDKSKCTYAHHASELRTLNAVVLHSPFCSLEGAIASPLRAAGVQPARCQQDVARVIGETEDEPAEHEPLPALLLASAPADGYGEPEEEGEEEQHAERRWQCLERERLIVKNTFLMLEEPKDPSLFGRPRSRSLPVGLGAHAKRGPKGTAKEEEVDNIMTLEITFSRETTPSDWTGCSGTSGQTAPGEDSGDDEDGEARFGRQPVTAQGPDSLAGEAPPAGGGLAAPVPKGLAGDGKTGHRAGDFRVKSSSFTDSEEPRTGKAPQGEHGREDQWPSSRPAPNGLRLGADPLASCPSLAAIEPSQAEALPQRRSTGGGKPGAIAPAAAAAATPSSHGMPGLCLDLPSVGSVSGAGGRPVLVRGQLKPLRQPVSLNLMDLVPGPPNA